MSLSLLLVVPNSWTLFFLFSLSFSTLRSYLKACILFILPFNSLSHSYTLTLTHKYYSILLFNAFTHWTHTHTHIFIHLLYTHTHPLTLRLSFSFTVLHWNRSYPSNPTLNKNVSRVVAKHKSLLQIY